MMGPFGRLFCSSVMCLFLPTVLGWVFSHWRKRNALECKVNARTPLFFKRRTAKETHKKCGMPPHISIRFLAFMLCTATIAHSLLRDLWPCLCFFVCKISFAVYLFCSICWLYFAFVSVIQPCQFCSLGRSCLSLRYDLYRGTALLVLSPAQQLFTALLQALRHRVAPSCKRARHRLADGVGTWQLAPFPPRHPASPPRSPFCLF